MHIDDILSELGKAMGLGDIGLDENRVLRLVFDDRHVVDMEATEDYKTLHIYSVLSSVPEDGKLELYEALLYANLFGQETGGATLCVDPSAKEVLLCTRCEMEKTDYQDFVNLLENFLNHVEHWKDKIEKIKSGAESKSSSGGGDFIEPGVLKV